MTDIQLSGRILIKADIEALTGLHIGGSSTGMEIGGVDKAVVRDPLTGRPFIPGSSLRGKMRSQLEKMLNARQNNRIGQVTIHTCKTNEEYASCKVCHIFGLPGEYDFSGPTLLVVRDTHMTDESADKLNKAHTDLAFTEIKTEVAIDRVTSAATPRNLERVPAGAVFSPAELVFSIYSKEDIARLKSVLDGMQLIEDDYIGGGGSRGNGKIRFAKLHITARSSKNYAEEVRFGDGAFATLQDLLKQTSALEEWARKLFFA